MLLLVQSYAPNKAPYINCLELSPSQVINLRKLVLSPTGSINLGFITEGNLLLCSSYLPLGVPNWVPTTHHQPAPQTLRFVPRLRRRRRGRPRRPHLWRGSGWLTSPLSFSCTVGTLRTAPASAKGLFLASASDATASRVVAVSGEVLASPLPVTPRPATSSPSPTRWAAVFFLRVVFYLCTSPLVASSLLGTTLTGRATPTRGCAARRTHQHRWSIGIARPAR
jgi:hypothetical protein